jgi:hypothetical protein
MLKNSDSDNDTKYGHTHNGRVFREVHLVNLFKQNYGEKGLYSEEEADLIDREHSKPVRTEEGKAKELHREEPETLETT